MGASVEHQPDGLLSFAFFAALAATPAYLGSNHPVMWAINAIVFAVLLIGYEIPRLAGHRNHAVGIRTIAWPLALFCCALAWIMAQITSFTPQAWHHPVWKLASSALDVELPGRITVNAEQTALAAMRLTTAAAVFWLALQLARTPQTAYRLLRWIALSAGFYAAAGFFWLAFAPDHPLWFQGQETRGWFHGPFVNRNHYGTYAGLGLLAALGLILHARRDTADASGGGLRLRLRALLNTFDQTGSLLPVSAGLLFVSLLLTGSRGALAAAAVGIAILAALTLRRSGRSGAIELAAIGGLAIGGALYLFGDLLAARIEQDGAIDDGRLAAWRLVLNAITANPWLGYGYGAFEDAFPLSREGSVGIRHVWDKAHNSWLEIVHGMGIPAGLAFIASIAAVAWMILRGAVSRHRTVEVPAVALAAAGLVATHALVDFSLQLQAVSLHFAALLGAGLAQARSSAVEAGD